MPRLARAVFPGAPHHVTQRGNGRQQTFFSDRDYRLYRDLLGEYAAASNVEVWGWVLMPNHVHLILVPHDEDALRRTLAPLHRYYAGHVHKRVEGSGHFWQGRFGCVAMDEDHLRAALKYVVLNPVRARLCQHAQDWAWSSVHAYLGLDDGLTKREAVLSRCPDITALLGQGDDEPRSMALRRAESIGRPLGSDAFIADLETRSGRTLRPRKPGRPTIR